MKANPQESKSLVLIVDDEPFIRMILRNFLEREAYQIVEAQNGIEALTMYNQLHPDIILLDAIMPDMDGFECCTQLQILGCSKHTPVLMITGLEDEESVDRAFEVGGHRLYNQTDSLASFATTGKTINSTISVTTKTRSCESGIAAISDYRCIN